MPGEGFRIARGYVEIEAELDPDAADRAGRVAGERAGDGFFRGADGRLRDSRGRFASELGLIGDQAGEEGGRRGGMSFLRRFREAIGSGLGDMATGWADLSAAMSSNPYVAAAGTALGVTLAAAAAPAIAAGISGALIGATGLGVIAIAAKLVAEEPAVVEAAKRLKEAAGNQFKDMAKPLAGEFAKALDRIAEIVTGDKIAPKIRQMFLDVGPAILPLTEALGKTIENMMPGLSDMVKASTPFLIEVGKQLPKLGDGISRFFSAIAEAGPSAAVFFGDLIELVSNVIAGLGVVIAWVAKTYVSIRSFVLDVVHFFQTLHAGVIAGWQAVITFVSGVWAEMQTWPGRISAFFARVGAAISGFFSRAGSAISGWWSSFVGWLTGALSATGSAISGWVSSVVAWFQALPGRVIGFMTALPGRLRAIFWEAFDLITYTIGYGTGLVIAFFRDLPGRAAAAVSSLWSAVSTWFNETKTQAIMTIATLTTQVTDWFQALPGRASAAVSSLWATVSGWFHQTKDQATSVITDMVTATTDWFRALPGRASSAVSSLWSAVSGWFISTKNAAVSTATDLVNQVTGWLSSLPGRAASAVSGFASAVAGQLRGAVSSAYGIGADIIRGVINGINSMIGAAVDAARRAASNIVRGAKDALGIQSPSRVFALEVGAQIPPGIAQGVQAAMPRAIRSVADQVGRLPREVAVATDVRARAAGMAAGAGQTVYHFAPGSVVLDASKIRSLEDVISLIGGLQRTARQFGAAVPRGA